MSRKLPAKVRVRFVGVDIFVGNSPWPAIGITAEEAISLHRSLTKNMKRIKANAKAWKE